MSTIAPSAVGTGRSGPGFPRLRRAALAALVANIGIVLTGGIVRVSESGLGCPDWPACEGTRVVPAAADAQWHTFVEFGNRLLTFVVLAAAVWVVLAARREARDRPDLRRLAWVQPVGVGAQAALGGVTVLTGLHPLVVAAHFLASMALVAAAVVLVGRTDPRPHDDVTGLRLATGAVVVVAGAVLVLGTLVTGSGPHAGDPGTVRLGLDIRTIAVAHADAVWLLVGATVAVLAVAVAMGATRVRRAATLLLGLELAQGGLGYLQYALGVPPLPVVFHILGAALVWAAAWHLAMAVRPGPDRASGQR
ncbi:COX15/CtaA family protein [Salsipaludibacter albus]|uniref:COX15/CtaA family protein n=1 Tax=Salsipaludibacter albus TaxID=2849650 RepID=UPI001EE41B74|nr:COX15/CtaA family protein [Salsipaludibacter albus]MBY5161798.1 COX15/CtaA family protein [Salsipaludibacter albus]